MIELQCENCGKRIKAPDNAAGKQGKCPGCGRSIYIPSTDDAIDELPLASESSEDRRREEALLEERRRLDRIIAKENRTPPESSTSGSSGGDRNIIRETPSSGSRIPATEPTSLNLDMESVVIEYLVAMRDSDFERSHEAVATLRRHRDEARKLVDRLAADQIPPSEMSRVPMPVYQGFLKNLRTQLG